MQKLSNIQRNMCTFFFAYSDDIIVSKISYGNLFESTKLFESRYFRKDCPYFINLVIDDNFHAS